MCSRKAETRDRVIGYIHGVPDVGLPPLIESTLVQTRLGASDPTCRIAPGLFRRALLTPVGPGVLVVELSLSRSGLARVEATGPGQAWILDRHRDMLGLNDAPPTLIAVHPQVEHAQKRYGQLRLARTRTPYQDLLMAVLGQRITARDAAIQWRRLVQRYGEPLPEHGDLMLPPDPDRLSSVPYYELHRLGIERRRADALRRVAEHASWLLGLADDSVSSAAALTASLTRIPGIGVWTAAVAGGTAFGDPDALRVGDFHVKNTVCWVLAGSPRGSDAEMVDLLAPYSGQRERVVRWLQASFPQAPRFGPGRRNVDVALM